MLFGKDATKILHVEVAAQRSKRGIVTLALERVFLEQEESALHPVLALLHDEKSIAQALATAPTAEVSEGDNVVEAVATDLLAFRAGVFEAALAADVDQDLCREPANVFSEEGLPDRRIRQSRCRTLSRRLARSIGSSRSAARLSVGRWRLRRTNLWGLQRRCLAQA